MNKVTRIKARTWIIGVGSALLILMASIVNAGPFHGKHGMGNPLERMLDHIDLTETQEVEVQEILKTLPEKKYKKGFGMMRDMIELDPEDPNYMAKVEEHAEAASEMMAQHIKQIAKARQDIYGVLTAEQKLEIEEAIARKMKRMEKRMAKHD